MEGRACPGVRESEVPHGRARCRYRFQGRPARPASRHVRPGGSEAAREGDHRQGRRGSGRRAQHPVRAGPRRPRRRRGRAGRRGRRRRRGPRRAGRAGRQGPRQRGVTMAESLSGIGVSPGVAAGPVAQMAPPPVVPTDASPSGDPEAENQAAMAAMQAVATSLEERASRAPQEAASVLAAQAMMAVDPTLGSKVTDAVQAGKAAITAVVEAFEEFRGMLAAAGPYMAERVTDLDDLRNRTVATLLGVPAPGHPFVLVALDLAPADTATLDKERVRAIITEEGGPTSHTAILAKSLGIPGVVTCHGATAIPEGETVLVDGTEGTVAVAPDEATVQEALDAEEAKAAALRSLSGPGRTSDGHPVQLLVNIAGDKDLAQASAADSEGVGLFRTEFLFLDRPNAPTREEQQQVYQRVFDAFAGRKVVVRTLDAGADKPLEVVTVHAEPT